MIVGPIGKAEEVVKDEGARTARVVSQIHFCPVEFTPIA